MVPLQSIDYPNNSNQINISKQNFLMIVLNFPEYSEMESAHKEQIIRGYVIHYYSTNYGENEKKLYILFNSISFIEINRLFRLKTNSK